MNILILGAHNRESANAHCTSIMIDGKIILDAGGMSDGLTIAEQLKIQAILLSHAHYDHVRDIPNIAMTYSSDITLFHHKVQLNIYTTEDVRDAILKHFFNGIIYGNFTERPPESPAVKFFVIQPDRRENINGYSVLPVAVNHRGVPTTAYEITDASSTTVFYTSDTGPGLGDAWKKIGTPKLLITEVTLDNKREEASKRQGHLTASLLKQELVSFGELKGYLPRVIIVHMNPELEKDIRSEVAEVAGELNAPIELAYEGMEIKL